MSKIYSCSRTNERDEYTIILQNTGVLHLFPLINHLASNFTAKTGETNFSVPKIQ